MIKIKNLFLSLDDLTIVKFMYPEKATKFDEISKFYLKLQARKF